MFFYLIPWNPLIKTSVKPRFFQLTAESLLSNMGLSEVTIYRTTLAICSSVYADLISNEFAGIRREGKLHLGADWRGFGSDSVNTVVGHLWYHQRSPTVFSYSHPDDCGFRRVFDNRKLRRQTGSTPGTNLLWLPASLSKGLYGLVKIFSPSHKLAEFRQQVHHLNWKKNVLEFSFRPMLIICDPVCGSFSMCH